MEYAAYQERRKQHLERIKKLRLFDDDFFTRCFEGSPECVELLLHIILNRSDLHVVEVKVQYTIKNLQGRSVRLDVLAVDDAETFYNIEIQRKDDGASPRRARFNSSLVDANILLTGDDVEKLPENYVIFITENDVLHGNKPVYHINRAIQELDGRAFDDGSHILYVNGAWRDKSPLGRLMHDFSCPDPNNMNYPTLADRVRYFKEDEEGIQTMCKIFEDYGKEMLDEGIKRGRKEGIKEGRKEGIKEGAKGNLLENIKSLMLNLNFTIEQAMDALSVPPEDRDNVKSHIALP